MKKFISYGILIVFSLSCTLDNKESVSNKNETLTMVKTKENLTRKEKTEKFLEQKRVKINYNLPHIESEEETTLRSPKEIALRVTILATTNMVAFDVMSGIEATEYLKKYNLWDHVTPNEKDFLANPTYERKNHESWKCEGIWTLLWALKKVDKLGYPNQMCDLNIIPHENYPIGKDKDPNDFIKSITECRTKTEILDANDLYYRFDWACVDARINGVEIDNLNPGVVYERHYTLNWLVNYMEQEWDDVTTDT